MRLQNKVSVITGAAGGIGLATVQKFAQEGAIIAVCDLNKEAVEKIAQDINTLGGKAKGYVVNVVDKESIQAMYDDVLKNFGRVDVLCNIAGITQDAQLIKMTDEQFDSVVDINLKGTYNMTRAIVNQMVAQGYGVVLNTSSVVGVYGNFGQTNYAATKFGVIGFAKVWARELGKKGIRANAICPGFVATPMVQKMPENIRDSMAARIPMKRMAEPREIADLFAFLASDEASYINGAAIEITGGLTL